MREIYRGNGFVITTNDCDEIFISSEALSPESLRISGRWNRTEIHVSYLNTQLEMIPISAKTVAFKPRTFLG